MGRARTTGEGIERGPVAGLGAFDEPGEVSHTGPRSVARAGNRLGSDARKSG